MPCVSDEGVAWSAGAGSLRQLAGHQDDARPGPRLPLPGRDQAPRGLAARDRRAQRAGLIVGLYRIVERRFAWPGRHRRLSKDHDYNVQTSETLIEIAAIRTMLHHLAQASTGSNQVQQPLTLASSSAGPSSPRSQAIAQSRRRIPMALTTAAAMGSRPCALAPGHVAMRWLTDRRWRPRPCAGVLAGRRAGANGADWAFNILCRGRIGGDRTVYSAR